MVLYECDKCNKTFNLKGDYDRHVNRKYSCAKIPVKKIETDTNTIMNKLEEIAKSNTALEKSNKFLVNKLEKFEKNVEKLEKELRDIKKKTKGLTINVDVTVNIIEFGKEDPSFLTEAERLMILDQGLKSVTKYVEMVHCNKSRPEYSNIYVSSRKNINSSIMIHNGSKWTLSNKDRIDDLRDKGIEFVEDQYDELKDSGKVIHQIIKKMDRFTKHLENDTDGKLRNKIGEEIKLLLYNNRPSV
jgi:uncharacterized C2H2 Zn-finger protein/uncharacterized protein (UPF0335 family)